MNQVDLQRQTFTTECFAGAFSKVLGFSDTLPFCTVAGPTRAHPIQ